MVNAIAIFLSKQNERTKNAKTKQTNEPEVSSFLFSFTLSISFSVDMQQRHHSTAYGSMDSSRKEIRIEDQHKSELKTETFERKERCFIVALLQLPFSRELHTNNNKKQTKTPPKKWANIEMKKAKTNFDIYYRWYCHRINRNWNEWSMRRVLGDGMEWVNRKIDKPQWITSSFKVICIHFVAFLIPICQCHKSKLHLIHLLSSTSSAIVFSVIFEMRTRRKKENWSNWFLWQTNEIELKWKSFHLRYLSCLDSRPWFMRAIFFFFVRHLCIDIVVAIVLKMLCTYIK